MKRCFCGFLPLPDATHCPKCGKPIESAANVPDIVTFVDEDGKDLGWGDHKLTMYERELIAVLMARWHQSFETTFLRMIRSGLRSLKRKAATA